ncbi:hypothetical protein [Burkholderia stagnalis]|uniref:hypothetical protein n=1 Tax=Burkholderia stagnalis TaxID=1503054 RepID=UPI000AC7E145|nr:hypothetical protein [Burkholderia stagnalis]
MKKKNARQPEPTSANEQRNFRLPSNLRHLRVIHALMVRSRPREEIDRIAGCSNGPDLIAALRRVGLDVPCALIPAFDRDGLPVKSGVYFLSESDRRKVARWLKVREAV